MGCDIHLVVEHKRDGKWQYVFDSESFYHERHYEVFAILANIRNSHGLKPISAPRGYPEDIDSELIKNDPLNEDFYRKIQLEEATIWLGDHSHSWLLLSELLAYPWDALSPVPITAYIDLPTYEKWDHKSIPYPYCSWTGGDAIMIDEKDYLALKELNNLIPGRSYYIKVSWSLPHKEIVGESFKKFLEKLQRIDPDSNNVRIIFGFDS